MEITIDPDKQKKTIDSRDYLRLFARVLKYPKKEIPRFFNYKITSTITLLSLTIVYLELFAISFSLHYWFAQELSLKKIGVMSFAIFSLITFPSLILNRKSFKPRILLQSFFLAIPSIIFLFTPHFKFMIIDPVIHKNIFNFSVFCLILIEITSKIIIHKLQQPAFVNIAVAIGYLVKIVIEIILIISVAFFFSILM